MTKLCGYTGKILRVDLSTGKNWIEDLDDSILSKWIGGTGLGAKILWKEVPREVSWDSVENRLIFATGFLSGTGFNGAGGFSVVGKGPMTNEAECSQANEFFGACLKFSGFDAISFEGISQKRVYFLVKEGKGYLEDAGHLRGRNPATDSEHYHLSDSDSRTPGRRYGVYPNGDNLSNGGFGPRCRRWDCRCTRLPKLRSEKAQGVPKGIDHSDLNGLLRNCRSRNVHFGFPVHGWRTHNRERYSVFAPRKSSEYWP